MNLYYICMITINSNLLYTLQPALDQLKSAPILRIPDLAWQVSPKSPNHISGLIKTPY